MSKFVLAREGKGGPKSLPGDPVAIVRSSNPALNKLFLCTVETAEEDARKVMSDVVLKNSKSQGGGDERTVRNQKTESNAPWVGRPPPGMETQGGSERMAGKRKRDVDASADPEETLREQPFAHAAARMYEDDSKTPLTLKAKEARMKAKKKRFAGGKAGYRGPSDSEEDSDEENKDKALASDKCDFMQLPLGSFFEPLPPIDPDVRLTEYAAGKAGSGKSVYSAGLIRRFTKMYPGRPVFGVCKTKLENDKAYAGLGIKQLPLGFFEGAGTGRAFDVEKAFGSEGCLILFDDWDSLEKSDLLNIQGAIKDVLNLGRKLKISVIVTSHLLTNYNQTRGIIHEANDVTVFPKHELPQSIYYLCLKLGLNKDVVARLRRKGRWVTIHNTHPCYVLSETEAEMIAF
jgi:hypothetical protein